MRVRGVILHDAAVQDSGCRRFGVPSLSASCLVLQHPKRGGGLSLTSGSCVCPEAGGITTHSIHVSAARLALSQVASTGSGLSVRVGR